MISKNSYTENKLVYTSLYNNVQSGGKSDKEIEWAWFDIDIDNIRKLLKKNKAKLVQEKIIMPLITFTHPTGNKDSYIRIRHEGHHITMTSKTDLKSEFVTEYEVVIDSFEQGIKILKSLGCKKRYYVEKLRETWTMPGCKEIVIDSYPGTIEYLEIDAHTVSALKKTAKLLGLSKPMKRVNLYNKYYGMKLNRPMSDLTFNNGYKEHKKYIKKNHSLYKRILKQQQTYYIKSPYIKNIHKIIK
tara:strand:+ start:83 stop:814 length:732 start_codon:yes stop_codon:yes gene_type:complete